MIYLYADKEGIPRAKIIGWKAWKPVKKKDTLIFWHFPKNRKNRRCAGESVNQSIIHDRGMFNAT